MVTKVFPKICYVCGVKAETREHIPPKSWFPKGQNSSLITVPSCNRHNVALQHDQEYVRIIAVTEQTTNHHARSLSQNKVIRSITRSERLFSEIFSNAEPALANDGKSTAKLTADLKRFRIVFQMIAYGLYFYLNKKRYIGGFDIYSPNLTNTGEETERDREYKHLLSKASTKMHYSPLSLPNEEVFSCGQHVKNEFEFLYRLEFYGGFTVLALSVPPWRCGVRATGDPN